MMSINSAVSLSMPPIPFGGIPGFDNNQIISQNVMGIIAEYVGCIAGQEDQPSWSVDRHHEYFRVLFAPRLNLVRLSRIVQRNNELNKEYAFYQHYKRIEHYWKMSKWILSNHSAALDWNLQNIAEDRVFYSSPTLRQYWFKYLASLHHALLANTPPAHLVHLAHVIPNTVEHALLELSRAHFHMPSNDPRVRDIQLTCDAFDQENNGVDGVVFPTQRLRAMVQSMRETFYADIASCEAQRARNVKSRFIFKRALDCVVAVCLIARRILSAVIPPLDFWKYFMGGCIVGLLGFGIEIILITGSSKEFMLFAYHFSQIASLHIKTFVAFSVAFYQIFERMVYIENVGVRRTWALEKECFKNTIEHIGHIWRSRELITDVLIEGVTAHASIAMESIRRLGPIQGLRHGYRVLSRIARRGLV